MESRLGRRDFTGAVGHDAACKIRLHVLGETLINMGIIAFTNSVYLYVFSKLSAIFGHLMLGQLE